MLRVRWRPRQSPMEQARLPQAQGQSPRQEPGLCSVTRQSCAFLAAPSAPGLAEGWAAGRGKEPSRRGQQFWGPPRACAMDRVGHSIALQGTLDPSCLRVDLICEAAAQSGAEGSLARAGMTGRDRNFLKRDRGGFPEQRMQRFLFPEPPTKFQSVERTAHTL